MAAKIAYKGKDSLSRFELVRWINDTLKTEVLKVEELRSGAAYCQLMDILFYDLVPLNRVKFCTSLESDYFQNYKILQASFDKINVRKLIPVGNLMKGRASDHLEFLQWFFQFFEVNYNGRKYDAVAARNRERIGPSLSDKHVRSKSVSRVDEKQSVRLTDGQGRKPKEAPKVRGRRSKSSPRADVNTVATADVKGRKLMDIIHGSHEEFLASFSSLTLTKSTGAIKKRKRPEQTFLNKVIEKPKNSVGRKDANAKRLDNGMLTYLTAFGFDRTYKTTNYGRDPMYPIIERFPNVLHDSSMKSDIPRPNFQQPAPKKN